MKKTIFLAAIFTSWFSLAAYSNDANNADVNDPRGVMKPWDKGAWETGYS
jgi:hypothetical protein